MPKDMLDTVQRDWSKWKGATLHLWSGQDLDARAGR